ncbi:LacI family DNA-binding transcriptional regulator [Alicyclobacillus fastidiosus]|uniref:LacI family DNA-binding transcriptional regulator n=1 Tax=Alicyclobacillus fastidiosus TaxID=392011 RepID=A0ABV5ADB2_9BACL|nr:LacI family DNA-binding transcriptional regulator [Alicyclobacillus fastidiosus]WEH08746.1 LacI family DNA-binding transcriptional regulator [Alicyclobacillus fastidiosus]
MSKKVTMQQIADQAGVSKYAVSKALSGQSGVSQETRDKIVKIATQLGYFIQPQVAAGARRPAAGDGRKANTVLILLQNVRMQNRASSYWGRIVDGMIEALKHQELNMMIVTEHSPEHFLGVLNPSGLLGIIGVGHVANPVLLEVRKLGIPCILVDHEDDTVPCDSLFINNFDASSRLTNYLIGVGHRRLQFIGDISFAESFFERWLAFRTALEKNGIPVDQNESFLREQGMSPEQQQDRIAQEVESMRVAGRLPSALVCANDSIAINAIRALTSLGIRVPEDVSVTGFDDIDDVFQVAPALTTVHVDKEAMGSRAVDMLLRRVEAPDAKREKLLLSGDVVFRDSVAHVQPPKTMADNELSPRREP